MAPAEIRFTRKALIKERGSEVFRKIRPRPPSSPQRYYTENWKHIFPEKELRGHSPNSYIHVSVCYLYIPTIGLHILLQENSWTDPSNIEIAHRHMNAEIGLTPRSSFFGNT